MSRSGDVLQIVIMTMFMVSGILLLVNMVFARQRDESRRTVEQAVRDHAALQRELTDETFRG